MSIFFIYKLYSAYSYKKVRASAITNAIPVVPNQPAATKQSQPTAADILGLKRQRTAGQQKTIPVEKEVDQYLSDSNSGTGILEFWQVI